MFYGEIMIYLMLGVLLISMQYATDGHQKNLKKWFVG